jgi:hypothetical protein
MTKIKYKVEPKNWSNVIFSLNIIKNWSSMTYTELIEDGEKYVVLDFFNNDLEEAFYVGSLISQSEDINVFKQMKTKDNM